MAISTAHSDAARQNGAQSKGPVTAAGRARSSQNARKHNLLGSTKLLSCEDQEEFDEIAEAFLGEYQPTTPTEQHYVGEMIDAEFRLQRVRAFSTSIQETRMALISDSLNMDVAAAAFDQLTQEGPALTLLLRYENQFRRQFDKSCQTLLDHRRRSGLDQQRAGKAAAQGYEQAIHDFVMAPTPGEKRKMAEEPPTPTPDSSDVNPTPPVNPSDVNPSDDNPSAPDPSIANPGDLKSSNINGRKEPSTPAPQPRFIDLERFAEQFRNIKFRTGN